MKVCIEANSYTLTRVQLYLLSSMLALWILICFWEKTITGEIRTHVMPNEYIMPTIIPLMPFFILCRHWTLSTLNQLLLFCFIFIGQYSEVLTACQLVGFICSFVPRSCTRSLFRMPTAPHSTKPYTEHCSPYRQWIRVTSILYFQELTSPVPDKDPDWGPAKYKLFKAAQAAAAKAGSFLYASVVVPSVTLLFSFTSILFLW